MNKFFWKIKKKYNKKFLENENSFLELKDDEFLFLFFPLLFIFCWFDNDCGILFDNKIHKFIYMSISSRYF